MNVIFRVDASQKIGIGHVMRCLTLAEELQKRGAAVSFICRAMPGDMCDHIMGGKYPLHRLFCTEQQNCFSDQRNKDSMTDQTRGEHANWPGVSWEEDANDTKNILQHIVRQSGAKIDWLVVDHYALDKRWEEQMRPFVERVMVIDDLADRPHDCDLLLDQNLYKDMENRYQGIVPEHCIQLLGPKYALLRPEFRKSRKKQRVRNGTVKRILIFFGGSDSSNETAKALEAIQMLDRPDIAVDVVVGSSNPHKGKVKEICESMPNTMYYCQVESMAELMFRADLAIGAGGSATWERCCLGLPAITTITVENQKDLTLTVETAGAILNLGYYDNVSSININKALRLLLNNKGRLNHMRNSALNIMEENDLGNETIAKSMVG